MAKNAATATSPEAPAEGTGSTETKTVAETRQPADPRLKVLKKFHGRFLPKGPLRDRLKALMVRWDSGEDHGGVTYEELKAVFDDWKAVRLNRKRSLKPKA